MKYVTTRVTPDAAVVELTGDSLEAAAGGYGQALAGAAMFGADFIPPGTVPGIGYDNKDGENPIVKALEPGAGLESMEKWFEKPYKRKDGDPKYA